MMKAVLIGLSCLMLGGCMDLSLKRERGETVNGYTTYTTTLHVELVDEPVCQGSCKP
ncbi:MAG: hypothetical protein ABT940_00610 [Alphaproteobacteria bacterium]